MNDGQYVTDCPECGDDLYLFSCQVLASEKGIRIEPDGFDVAGNTDEEILFCRDGCGEFWPLMFIDNEPSRKVGPGKKDIDYPDLCNDCHYLTWMPDLVHGKCDLPAMSDKQAWPGVQQYWPAIGRYIVYWCFNHVER